MFQVSNMFSWVRSTNANQIIPRLWLGNFGSSQSIDFLRSNHITVIINCTKDLPFLKLSGVYKYRVPVHDNLQPLEQVCMAILLERILPIIQAHYQEGRSILIHCAAGMQRSAIVLLSYLYQYHYHNAMYSFQMIKSRRPIAFEPSINFKPSFCAIYGQNACHQLP